MIWGSTPPASLLELILPEHCSVCEAVKGTVTWCPKGPTLSGLRSWDGPHMCAECFSNLQQASAEGQEWIVSGESAVPVVAGQRTHGQLVDLVGQWKYKGLRGLVWPLSQLLQPALSSCHWLAGSNLIWVPLPLHGRRQRERGFNQACMLAGQLAWTWGGQLCNDLVVRRRNTGQQAKLESDAERADNLRDAFGAGKGLRDLVYQFNTTGIMEELPRIILVDDLVTSGATAGALVHLIHSWGLSVEAVVCLGVASSEGRETPDC